MAVVADADVLLFILLPAHLVKPDLLSVSDHGASFSYYFRLACSTSLTCSSSSSASNPGSFPFSTLLFLLLQLFFSSRTACRPFPYFCNWFTAGTKYFFSLQDLHSKIAQLTSHPWPASFHWSSLWHWCHRRRQCLQRP